MEVSATTGSDGLVVPVPTPENKPELTAEEAQQLQVIEQPLREKMQVLAKDEAGFHQLMKDAFGRNYHATIAENIRREVLGGHFDFLPQVQFVDAATLNGHAAAYRADQQTVLLNRDASTETLQSVYMEEVGHHFDQRMSETDAQGDEGALFRLLLTEGDTAQVRQSQPYLIEAQERDAGWISLNHQMVPVEFAGLTVEIDGVATDASGQQPDVWLSVGDVRFHSQPGENGNRIVADLDGQQFDLFSGPGAKGSAQNNVNHPQTVPQPATTLPNVERQATVQSLIPSVTGRTGTQTQNPNGSWDFTNNIQTGNLAGSSSSITVTYGSSPTGGTQSSSIRRGEGITRTGGGYGTALLCPLSGQ